MILSRSLAEHLFSGEEALGKRFLPDAVSGAGAVVIGVANNVINSGLSAREEAGLTSREVSVRMGRAHSFLSKCETGERSIEVFELIQLAQIYDKPPQYFLSQDQLLSV